MDDAEREALTGTARLSQAVQGDAEARARAVRGDGARCLQLQGAAAVEEQVAALHPGAGQHGVQDLIDGLIQSPLTRDDLRGP